MLVTLAHIGPRSSQADDFARVSDTYVRRITPHFPCEAQAFRSESAFLEWVVKSSVKILPVLLDSRGRTMTSEAFAAWIAARRDESARHLAFAIGPADGWSPHARERAHLLLSLGPMTLAHGLARLVLAEQVYRACTILAGHPYHSGH